MLSAAAVALLAGCSASPGTLTNSNTSPIEDTSDWVWSDHEEQGADAPNTGLAALSGLDYAAMAAQSAADLETIQASGTADDDTIVMDAPPQPRRRPTGQSREDDALLRAISISGDGVPEQAVEPSESTESDITIEPAPAKSRSMRIAELSAELSKLLKEEALEQSDPARPLVAAALLESAANGVIDEIDLPGGGPLMLTEDERSALMSIRELAVRLAGQSDEIGGDPQRIREVLIDAAEQLRDHARVRIGKAELCTRAPGFGSYVPLERKTFLAGRMNRMVVYTEVEHFGLRTALTSEAMTSGDTVAAEITQELELYLRAGDSKPTWQRRIDWLPRTSRRSFEDMFLAQAIELPSTLTVGEYDLKIRVIDEVTGAQDESVIPIRIVADTSALDEEPSEGPNSPNLGNQGPPVARVDR
ncbi:MAG: hypothetical protein KDA31_05545 [Phycisphaerales bacterium]|nr:hypothetical protein [Phycisphaerales bacterium]MCB9835744.1 hypothetical protein [Phycisphaera sp.]